MFRSHLLLSLALAGAAWPAGAALQFTNVTSLTGVSANLRGVSYDGTANFVATGATNSTILRGAFTNSLSPGPNVAWSSTTLSQSLLSATYGAGMFLAGGYNASVFESLNGSQWVKTNNAFQNTAAVYGLAFNPTAGGSGRFAAVASIFEIYVAGSNLKWSPASLPQGSALESYNGVTAFGTGRFAACGIFGNIRLSADGGLT